MPVLNQRDSFEVALMSVFSQGHSPIEIIVIDGGSVDGTIDVIKKHSSRIVFWETGKDSGICNAFNRGVLRATGDVIAILNSDDWWEKDTLINILASINASPDGDIYHGSIRYVEPANQYYYQRHPSISSLHRRMTVFHPTMFVKKSCYEMLGVYDEQYMCAMDSEWCHRALMQEMKFCEVPAVLANMSLGGVSDQNYLCSLREYRDSVIKHGLAGKAEAYCYFYFYAIAKTVMRTRFMRPVKKIRDKLMY